MSDVRRPGRCYASRTQPDVPLPIDDLGRLKSLYGHATSVWAGEGTRVEPDRWSAFSGCRSVEYNLILCHADTDGETLTRSVEDIAAAKVPALLMVTGTALAHVQQLIERSWVCVGAVPFMIYQLPPTPAPPVPRGIRLMDAGELHLARDLIADVFALDSETARVAMPADVLESAGRTVWGRFVESGELVSCVISTVNQGLWAGWSLATAVRARGQGHGRLLLETCIAAAAEEGARVVLAQVSAMGEPLYRSMGWRVLEHWQLWTRPRWVLGRS